MDVYRKYWKEHWKTHDKLKNSDPQQQVGRTKFGESITEENWARSCKYIFDLLGPESSDVILDLCCGNGLLSAYLINYVDRIIALDYSQALLTDFVTENTRIDRVLADAIDYDFSALEFDRAVMYFAAQHFDETSLLSIIRNIYDVLPVGGSFLIGDVPDQARKWRFYSKPEYREFYFRGIESRQPSVGYWYGREFFEYLSEYVGFESVIVSDQPEYMTNSNHRFDVLYKK